ncbi:hypothetical protein [Streptomyces caniferus]|uniref:hypothetical protein n=1 Tax=Streptomyces caniferus TaxID=285557 RepID=UPI00337AE21A
MDLAAPTRDLKNGCLTSYPELVLFTTWGNVQDYASNDPAGRDLQPLAGLVDSHGTDAFLAAVAQLIHEDQADVTVPTVHKAKGREWLHVRIADDFQPPSGSNQQDNTGCPYPAGSTTAKPALPTLP